MLETMKGSVRRRWRSLNAVALGIGLFSVVVAAKVSVADTVPGAAEEQSGSTAVPEGEAHPAPAGDERPAGEAHDATHEAGHGTHEQKGPITSDLRDVDLAVWSLITFVVFVVVLKKLAWGPLIEGLEKRESGVLQNIADAESA